MDETNYPHYLEQMDYSIRTSHAYLTDINCFARWFKETNGDELKPNRLTLQDLKEYKSYLLTVDKASAATINRRLSAIKSYIRWGLETGQIDYDPSQRIKGIAVQETAPKWLDRREQGQLQRELERRRLAAQTSAAKLQSIRDLSLYYFLVNSGLRISEACALELSDLTLGERSGSVHVLGKGEKDRTIPLNNTARQALRDWLAVRPSAENNFVFQGRNGQQLRPRTVQKDLEVLGQKTGVELTPHTLRHTFAKSLINAGISLEKVAMLLGHSSLETTRIYTTPSQADLARAVESLE